MSKREQTKIHFVSEVLIDEGGESYPEIRELQQLQGVAALAL